MQSMKWLVEKHLKAKFLEAVKKSTACGNSRDVYSFEMLQALRDMAEKDVWPDWRFSDQDCNVWSMYRNMAAKKVV